MVCHLLPFAKVGQISILFDFFLQTDDRERFLNFVKNNNNASWPDTPSKLTSASSSRAVRCTMDEQMDDGKNTPKVGGVWWARSVISASSSAAKGQRLRIEAHVALSLHIFEPYQA